MADPFSITGSAVGVISLGLTVFTGLLQYYGDWKDSEKDIAATYTSIEGLTRTFMLIKDTIAGQSFRRDIVDRVTESLTSCSAGVQNLEKKLAKIRSSTPDKFGEKFRAHARKAAYPFKKSTLIKLAEIVSDLRDNLGLAVDTLQLDVSASSLQKLKDISARLATLLQQSQSASADIVRNIAEVRLTQKEHDSRLLDQETFEMIAWLSPLNFSIRQNDVLSRRQQGAGNWLLQSDQFQTWLDGKVNILWCPGMPGAGKTVLASVIVEYLKQWTRRDDVAVGYVYCIYNATDQTATNLIASLFQQIVQQQPVLSDDVKSLYEHHRRERTRPLLPEYIRLLRAHIQRFSSVFIVVDALDECSEDDGVRDLFLAQLRYLLPNIRLLVTSRDLKSLAHAFEGAARLEIRANEDDLRTYLQVRIEEQALLKSHIKDDPSLEDTIISTIIDKADGMFLLAELHLNSLVNQDNRRRLRRALQSLPKEIDKSYDETMLRIESQDLQKVERAGQALSWISFAERPLTVRELQCALAIDPEDVEFDEEAIPNENALLSVCCGLVIVEQESDIVRFVHFTTEKYIEQIRQTRYPSAQKVLSGACLTYLSFKVFASGPRPWAIASAWLDDYPFLEYAVRHWGDHARKALEQGLDTEDSILKFLEARGSVGSFTEVVEILDSGWYSCNEDSAKMYEWFTNISDLHVASEFGLDKLVRRWLDQGIDVNGRDHDGRTPLHRAVAKGHDVTVRLLLEKGANIRAKDRDDSNVLKLAALTGFETVVETLFEHGLGVDNHTLDEFHPYSEFHSAAGQGHVQVIQTFFKRWNHSERNLDIIYEMLNVAASSGQERVVGLVLEEGRRLEGFDVSKSQALDCAAGMNHTSVMGLLLDAGADTTTASHTAALSGRMAATQLLLDKGADLEACNYKGENVLYRAVVGGHDKTVSLLLDQGANVEGLAANGETALIRAAAEGHDKIVSLLLDKGADSEAVSYDGDKALHKAAQNGWDKTTSLLLDRGAHVEGLAANGETALISAARHGLVHAVWQLLDMGADTAVKDRCYGWSALHWAIVQGHETVVQLLLEHETQEGLTKNLVTLTRLYHAIHADDKNFICELLSDKQMLQSRNIREFLSLHAAAEHGYQSVLEAFLENGAEVDGQTGNFDTASSQTAHEGDTLVKVKRFRKDKAAIGGKNNYSGTPLMLAARAGHRSVVKILLENGADIECKKNFGQTTLSLAALGGHTPVVELLLEKGADIECKDDRGRTALSAAVSRKRTPVVELLLANGAEIEAVDDCGETALLWAVGTCSVEIVRLLLQAGANVNSRGGFDNRTPLYQSVSICGAEEVVNMLIESGADVEAQNSKGETALVIAVREGEVAKTQLLLERGANPNTVEATVTRWAKFIYEVDFQEALELVLEAQKTWKGKDAAADGIKGCCPGT